MSPGKGDMLSEADRNKAADILMEVAGERNVADITTVPSPARWRGAGSRRATR
jgi:hypothetical protein